MATLTLTDAFTYLDSSPIVESVAPTEGTTAGGVSVTLTGSGFTYATGVIFDGSAATDFVVVDENTITCTAPEHEAGAIDVVVQTLYGDSDASEFTYVSPVTVTGVSPPTCRKMGGVRVTVRGTLFTGATSVTFDGLEATDLIVVNDTTITCVTPAHSASTVDVVVTSPAGIGVLVSGFTYYPTTILPVTIEMAEPGARIEVDYDSVLAGTGTAGEDGTVIVSIEAILGPHTLRARQIYEGLTSSYSEILHITGVPSGPPPPTSLKFGLDRVQRVLSGASPGSLAAPYWFFTLKGGDLGDLGGFGDTIPVIVDGATLPHMTANDLNILYGDPLTLDAVISDWSTGSEIDLALLDTHATPEHVQVDHPSGTFLFDNFPVLTGATTDGMRVTVAGLHLDGGTLYDLWFYTYGGGAGSSWSGLVSHDGTSIIFDTDGISIETHYVVMAWFHDIPQFKTPATDRWIAELHLLFS